MLGLNSIRKIDVLIGLLLIISGTFSFFSVLYSDKILPGVSIGVIDVGGLTKEEALDKIKAHFHILQKSGMRLIIDGDIEVIYPKNIGLEILFDNLAQEAISIGHGGRLRDQLLGWASLPFSKRVIAGGVTIDEQRLLGELGILASIVDKPRKDIRFNVNKKGEVNVLYDTMPGKILDQSGAKEIITSKLSALDFSDINLVLMEDPPIANSLLAGEAKEEAERMIQEEMLLSYESFKFSLNSERLGSWIVSEYDNDRLVSGLNEKLISEYVTEIAKKIDETPQNSRVVVEGGRAIDFTLPKYGRALMQDETISLIKQTLQARRIGAANFSAEDLPKSRIISLPVLVHKPKNPEKSGKSLGILEQIGKATTPFWGSPANRVHNIKNGVQFLTGILISPGEEFSTVQTLGAIDNTTGYLPELVIKGDETIPEFGGGLCQVSTTLFRAVMDAGLPIVERRNHSYRVPYYENDGGGNFIGPGLDATIYSPKPDFRFKNDTEATILIYGYVEGSKATFELYGTSDGRISKIDGPYTLSEESPGEAIYIKTTDLPEGETKKIDTAHSGGEAVATYTIEYSDGRIEEQEFRSFYRKWPAKYLIGTKQEVQAR